MINWLDIVILFLLAYSAVMGWKQGLVRQLVDVAGVIVAYFAALRYSRDFMLLIDGFIPFFRWMPDFLDQPTMFGVTLGDIVLRLIGFFLLYFLVRLLFTMAGGMLHSLFSLPVLSTLNRLSGTVLGITKGLLFGLILVAVGSLLNTPFWDKSMQGSVIATYVMEIWPVVYEQMTHFLLNGAS
jgi:uncharacterized membrane protein required for colicin V production